MATLTVGKTSAPENRQYATLQAAVDAIPSDPTALTDSYVIELYNDAEFTAGCVVQNKLTTGTYKITIKAAAGHSFKDNREASDTLFYDVAKGVGINATGADGNSGLIEIKSSYVTVEGLQAKMTGQLGSEAVFSSDAFLTGSGFKDCIIQKTYAATDRIVAIRDCSLINCLVVDSGSTASNNAVGTYENAQIINCTIVRVGTTGGTAFAAGAAATNLVKNTAVFNWSNGFAASTFSASSDYNGTDVASAPGANSLTSQTFADQFENTASDFRLKSTATLKDAGNTDSTNAPNDIIGTVRGTTTAGDIGAWEYVAGSTAKPNYYYAQL